MDARQPEFETGEQAPRTLGGEAAPGALDTPVAAADEQLAAVRLGDVGDDGQGARRLGRDSDGTVGLDDARLLGGDLLDRVAEDGRVLQIEGSNDGDEGGDDVGRVEGAAQADLDCGELASGGGE